MPKVEVKAASDGAGRGGALVSAVPGRGSTINGGVMVYYRKERLCCLDAEEVRFIEVYLLSSSRHVPVGLYKYGVVVGDGKKDHGLAWSFRAAL